MTCPTPEDIKCLVEYATEPIIFRNILQWNILNWNLDDWKTYLENLPLRYRRGKYCHTQVSMCSQALYMLLIKLIIVYLGTSVGNDNTKQY